MKNIITINSICDQYKHLTDYEVVQLTLNNKKLFSIIFNRYKNTLEYYLYSMTGNQGEAQEITQIALIKIYEKLDSYYPNFNFSTWVFSVARNSLIDHLRQKKVKEWGNRESYENCQYRLGAEEQVDLIFFKQEINQAINILPEKYREPLIFHINGYTYSEISEEFKISLTCVKTRLFRARSRLKILGFG